MAGRGKKKVYLLNELDPSVRKAKIKELEKKIRKLSRNRKEKDNDRQRN